MPDLTTLLAVAAFDLLCLIAMVHWLRRSEPMPQAMEPDPAWVEELAAKQRPEPTDLHVVALVKGGERYIVIYDDQHSEAAALTLGRWACHPELSLTWPEAQAGIDRVRGRKPDVVLG